MTNLRRPLVITFFASSGATVVHFIVSVLLARLLTPAEIGVYSITVVCVSIAHIFRDFGVATYLQREAELTPDKVRAAIGVLFATSWFIALSLFASSWWIAGWFGEPGITPVMQVLALGFIFIPFGAITHALLTREFAAEKQAVVTAAGTASYAASCLTLAALGFGTMSLAWANLINIIVTALAYLPYRRRDLPWMPSFRNWGKVLNFGAGTLIANCSQAINNGLPDVLLGKLGSATHVGLFSRANSTVTIFSYVAGTTVNYGSISYISQTHHRGEPLAPLLARATALLTGIGWPALALTALLGHDIVLTLYGERWLEAVPAITPLVAAAAITMLFNYTPTALTAIGRPYLSAVPILVTGLGRIGFAIALFDGSLRGFAWAMLLASLLAVPVLLQQQRSYLGFSPSQMLAAIAPSAGVTAVVGLVCAALLPLLPDHLPPALRLVVLAGPLALVWYLALRASRHTLTGEVHHFGRAIGRRLGFGAS